MKTKKLKDLIKERYYGHFETAAEAANTTRDTIKVWVSQGREVIELANGDWVLKSSKTIIFK